MKDNKIHEVTEDMRKVVRHIPSGRRPADKCSIWARENCTIVPLRVASNGRKSAGKARGLRDFIYRSVELALDGLGKLVDPPQVRFIGALME